MVDLRIQDVRRRAAHARGDQGDPGLVVHRLLVLGQHDQGGPGLVEPGIHAAGDLHAAGQGEPDVHAVGHRVRAQRAADLRGDLLVRRHPGEGQRGGRAAQPGEMLAEPEDPALVEPQSLPDRVTTLDRGVEGADRGLVAVRQHTAHVDDEVTVAVVKGLQHYGAPGSGCGSWAGLPGGAEPRSDGTRAAAGRTAGTARPARRAAAGGPGRRMVGAEPRQPPHRFVPVRCPDPVGVPRSRGPGQHGRGERHAQRRAQRAQHRLRVFQQVTGVDDGAAEPVEDLRLLPEAEIVQGGRGAHPGVGGQQLPRDRG